MICLVYEFHVMAYAEAGIVNYVLYISELRRFIQGFGTLT
jgi:hypothetical protein